MRETTVAKRLRQKQKQERKQQRQRERQKLKRAKKRNRRQREEAFLLRQTIKAELERERRKLAHALKETTSSIVEPMIGAMSLGSSVGYRPQNSFVVEILITVESFHSVSASKSPHEIDSTRKARYFIDVAILDRSKEFSNDQECPALMVSGVSRRQIKAYNLTVTEPW